MRALVLCAGFGTRLGELTADRPKPLLPVGGEPLLTRTLAYLALEGVDDVVINLHHLPDAIPAAVGDGAAFGVRVRYSHEATLLGTAGAVRHARDLLPGDDPILVLYGDLLIDEPLLPVLVQHRDTGASLTALVHRRSRSNSIVELDEQRRVVRFAERPPPSEVLAAGETWVNSGVYVVDPSVVDGLAPGTPVDFPADVFPALVRAGTLFAYPVTGYRCAIDSPQRLAEADAAVREGRYRPGGRRP